MNRDAEKFLLRFCFYSYTFLQLTVSSQMDETPTLTPKRNSNPLKREPTTPFTPEMKRLASKRKLGRQEDSILNYRSLELRYQRDVLALNRQLEQSNELIAFLKLEKSLTT